jgi:hypothetical protein
MSRKIAMCLTLFLTASVIACLLLNLRGAYSVFGTLNWVIPQATSAVTPPAIHRSAASNVQAFFQGDPGIGWESRHQYALWWPSACSPAALTMTLRAWGVPTHIGQVLDRLITLKAITPQNGLLHAEALESVAKGYGFQGITFWKWTLQDVAHITSQGVPVLANLVDAKRQTPYPAFSVGHWLVVVNVSANRVEVRDPSAYRIHVLSLSLFHNLFTGIGVVIWQGAAISLP